MKKLILFAALSFTISQAVAQKGKDNYPRFGNTISFERDFLSDGLSGDITIPDTAIYTVFRVIKSTNKRYVDSVQKARHKSYFTASRLNKLLLGVKLDPKLKYYRSDELFFSNSYRTFVITNNSEAVLVAMGINKNNVNDYRYHVVVNDSIEIVPWSIPKLAQDYGAKIPFGRIGKFKVPGKKLLIEVVNSKDYSIRDGVIFNWQTNFKPTISEIGFYKDGEYSVLADTSKHRLATRFDAVTGIPLDLKFRLDEIATLPISFAYHAPVPYGIYLVKKLPGKKPETTQIAKLGAFETMYNFHNDNYSEPGKYELVVKSQNPHDTNPELRIPFEVLPPLQLLQKYSIKQILPYVVSGLLFILICFAAYYFYNRRKLRSAERARAMATIQLKSVRSQLNPHFMFNALTSIQNLMNHHDTAGANHYLSKFANLTRQVLNSSGQELISLEDEFAIVTDYLQMEQLRFGFQYTIEADPNINKANTEIPAMLLQPFIENAAKHGVSALQGNGEIKVVITKQNQDLVLTVMDNGAGFNTAIKNTKGFGLKLSQERIELLNRIYKSQPIYLAKASDANGTKITIALTNWI